MLETKDDTPSKAEEVLLLWCDNDSLSYDEDSLDNGNDEEEEDIPSYRYFKL